MGDFMSASSAIKTHLRNIPAGVWILGFVSMLMDISSEMIHALLPIYMVSKGQEDFKLAHFKTVRPCGCIGGCG